MGSTSAMPNSIEKYAMAAGISRTVLLLLLVPQRAAQVVVQIGGQLVEPAQERLVERQLVKTRRFDGAQQRHRVTAAPLPQVRVDGREKFLSWLVPRPSQVGRQLVERGQTLGKVSSDGKPAEGFHASLPY